MKFKIGDKVRYIGDDIELKGKLYKIVDISEKFNGYTIYNRGHWFVLEDKLKLVQNTDSDKKDLIGKLINEYLLENNSSINEELFLKCFGDFCRRRLNEN